MTNIKSSEDLKEWLAGKPPELVIALASRIALRVLPIALLEASHNPKTAKPLISNAFRANAITRSVLNCFGHRDAAVATYTSYNARSPYAPMISAPNAAIALRSDAAHLAIAYTSASAHAAVADPDFVFAIIPNAIIAATYAAKAITPSSIIFDAISMDCSWWDTANRSRVDVLLELPLWPAEIPAQVARAWATFSQGEGRSSHWDQWTAWYKRKLNGSRRDWGLLKEGELDMACRLIEADEEFWQRGEEDPAYVNQQLTEWLADLTPSKRKHGPHDQVDFFVSYSQADEAMAREVTSALNEAGFTTFVQFENIPAGSNFVIEMDNGLSVSKGFIALYSQTYFKSTHCRAELAFAYNHDPDGAKRFARALLLEPCELLPLARQIVYRSLIGLDRGARKAAILDLAGYQPYSPSKEEAADFAQEIFSPKPVLTKAGKITVTPNPKYDTPTSPQDLLDPIRQMLGLLKALLGALDANAPRMLARNLAGYDEELRAHRARSHWGMLDRLMRHAETAFRQADPREFEPGLADQFEEILRLHTQCMEELPNADEKFNRLADTQIEESATGEAITAPIRDIERAAETLKGAGHTEEPFDESVNEVVRNCREIAYQGQPRPLPIIDPEAPDALDQVPFPAISSKKAGILGALGFALATYHLLGTTVTLVGRAGVAEAIGYLERAIHALIALLR